MKVIGCIPSRYASTRLPGKPLCDIGGKPMVLHIVEKAKQASKLDDVVVLTDDQRILDVVDAAGYQAIFTSQDCVSGTDRIAEYLQHDSSSDIFVNIQGDEILLNPNHIDHLIEEFTAAPNPQMGTLAHRVSDPDTLSDPTTAKVVIDNNNHALYFSRHCIPVTQNGQLPEQALVQIGVYIYTKDTLKMLTETPQTPLEQTEKLEQLRALESGINIYVSQVDDYQSLSVDTEEDLEKARALFQT
jgi:3-deoxy-manno-octulosonate cytidylyltransferase (CMP-KDO synthetase)